MEKNSTKVPGLFVALLVISVLLCLLSIMTFAFVSYDYFSWLSASEEKIASLEKEKQLIQNELISIQKVENEKIEILKNQKTNLEANIVELNEKISLLGPESEQSEILQKENATYKEKNESLLESINKNNDTIDELRKTINSLNEEMVALLGKNKNLQIGNTI